MPQDPNAKSSPVSDSGESPDVLPLSHQQRQKRLQRLLRGVSRTFYLSLTVLPKGLREPVGLAYLLARAADTIADTRLLPPDQRLGLLLSFRDQVRGPAQLPVLEQIKDALTEAQAIPEERTLLESLPEFLEFLESLPEDDRRLVRTVLGTLTYGMEGDLINFPDEDSGEIAALEHIADLEKYLYHVAGCVGQFWTEISAAHVAGLNGWDPGAMGELGVAYGKALQLTNVLRDLPKDLRIGRCYLPMEQLEPLGLEPPDLLNAEMGRRAWPALSQGIRTALGLLRRRGRILAGNPASLRAAEVGGVVANAYRAGHPVPIGPRRPGRTLVGAGASVPRQPQMGLPDHRPVIARSGFQPGVEVLGPPAAAKRGVKTFLTVTSNHVPLPNTRPIPAPINDGPKGKTNLNLLKLLGDSAAGRKNGSLCSHL